MHLKTEFRVIAVYERTFIAIFVVSIPSYWQQNVLLSLHFVAENGRMCPQLKRDIASICSPFARVTLLAVSSLFIRG